MVIRLVKSNNTEEDLKYKAAENILFFFSRRSFDVFYPVPEVPYIDVIVEGEGFLALVRLCKKCDLEDVNHVLYGAKVFEEMEGVKPNALAVFSYTGEMDPRVREEAERRGWWLRIVF